LKPNLPEEDVEKFEQKSANEGSDSYNKAVLEQLE